MRARPHSHPCSICKAKVECDGEQEWNPDGWPTTLCREFHIDNRLDWLCEACAEADAEQTRLHELENV